MITLTDGAMGYLKMRGAKGIKLIQDRGQSC